MARNVRVVSAAGCAGLYPPNTLEGVRAGVRSGAHIIEIDVALTRDEHLVARHDLRLNPAHDRDSAGRWWVPPCPAIKELTYSELRDLDIGQPREGSYYPLVFPQSQAIDGARIPLVEEVLQVIADSDRDPRPVLELELKSDPTDPAVCPSPSTVAREVARLARSNGSVSLAVSSFDGGLLQMVRSVIPDIPHYHLFAEGLHYRPEGFRELIRRAAAAGADAVGVHAFDATDAVISCAHGVGVDVMIWGLIDPFRVSGYVEAGVDMIVSVRPDLVMAELSERLQG